MTALRGTAAADLAADLMADLNTPPAPTDSAGNRALIPAAVDRPESRGRALQVVVRMEPLSWRWPSLRVSPDSVGMRVGVMYIEVGMRSS